ncbi:MAG: crossover junction endodeoxyribonuclease RuvC [Pseudomonadota bacterium]
MRVLGIDPGSTVTGYGIVELDGNSIRHLDNGGIRPAAGQSLAQRLGDIHSSLTSLIKTHRPNIAVVENVFFAKNARSSLILGHARGAAILAASSAGLAIAEYSPSEVKQAVTGNGRATKNQIQQMVRVILGLPEIAMEDASDALAVAICHCNSEGLRRRIEMSI